MILNEFGAWGANFQSYGMSSVKYGFGYSNPSPIQALHVLDMGGCKWMRPDGQMVSEFGWIR